MSRWWRAHDDSVDHPKLQRLPPALFKHWYNLMCIASSGDGALPPIGEVAFKLRVTEHKAAEIVTALVLARLFDKREDGVFVPHNWNKRQFKSDGADATNAERQKRYRQRHAQPLRNGESNGAETVTAKRPETETEKNAADAAPNIDLEKQLFARGKAVLGQSAGGLIAKLLKAKGLELARAAIETAATKQNPREYVGRILGGPAGFAASEMTDQEILREAM